MYPERVENDLLIFTTDFRRFNANFTIKVKKLNMQNSCTLMLQVEFSFRGLCIKLIILSSYKDAFALKFPVVA